jgi:hypothetical protein
MTVTRTSRDTIVPAKRASEEALSYTERLAAYEAQRRAAGNVLLRKMVSVLDPHPSA